MKVQTQFLPLDRYYFDRKLCSVEKGFAQVDTAQDAPYFGIWANPVSLTIVTYCEGDVTTQKAENTGEFVEEIRKLKEFYDNASRFIGIDCCLSKEIEARFAQLGLADLCH